VQVEKYQVRAVFGGEVECGTAEHGRDQGHRWPLLEDVLHEQQGLQHVLDVQDGLGRGVGAGLDHRVGPDGGIDGGRGLGEGWLYLTAFDSRFSSTWRSRRGSAKTCWLAGGGGSRCTPCEADSGRIRSRASAMTLPAGTGSIDTDSLCISAREMSAMSSMNEA